jgi:hypothetical protein
VLAHGVGLRGELPLPVSVFIWITAGVQLVGFFVLGLRWNRPKLAAGATGRVLVERRRVQPFVTFGRMVALAFFVLCLVAGFVGFDAPDRNILPVSFYVFAWVGAQLMAGLIGDVWSPINPVATLATVGERLASVLGRDANGGPTSWGHWPAAFGLVVFLFWELSHPWGLNPRTVAWLLALHVLVILVTGFLWGAHWVVDNEPFTVLFAKLGSMAPLFAVPDRPHGLGLRPPLTGLATMPVRAGTPVLLIVALGGTAFDGFAESEIGTDLFQGRFLWSLATAELGVMIMVISVVGALYYLAVAWADRTLPTAGFDDLWHGLAPLLVPIVLAYALAHYLQLLYNEIQSFAFRLSDPFGRDWNLLGLNDGLISPLDPDVAAWIQLLALNLGHLLALVVARDRLVTLTAQAEAPPARALQAGYGVALAVVASAITALWLLLAA